MPRPRYRRPKVGGYSLKSGLEGKVAQAIIASGLPLQYETDALIYQPDPATYIPDFKLGPSLLLEAKGAFLPADRAKMLAARRDNPGVRLVLLFEKPRNKCGRSTCAAWAYRNGFQWLSLPELPAYLEAVRDGREQQWWTTQAENHPTPSARTARRPLGGGVSRRGRG